MTVEALFLNPHFLFGASPLLIFELRNNCQLDWYQVLPIHHQVVDYVHHRYRILPRD
jgi:hypothetical protein